MELLVAGGAEGTGDGEIGKDDADAEEEGTGIIDAEDPGKDQPDPFVLRHAVNQRDDDGDHRREEAGHRGIVARLDKFGGGVLAEAADLSGEEDEEEDITAGPADDVSEGKVALEVEDAGDAEEGGGAHPVGGDRRADADAADGMGGDRIILPLARATGDADDKGDAEKEDENQQGNELEFR